MAKFNLFVIDNVVSTGALVVSSYNLFHFSKKIERHFSTEGDITVSRLLEFETFVISLKVLVTKNLIRLILV